MKDSTKDQVQGKAHEIKGKVKETVGRVTNNPNLGEGGAVDEKTAGKVQKRRSVRSKRCSKSNEGRGNITRFPPFPFSTSNKGGLKHADSFDHLDSVVGWRGWLLRLRSMGLGWGAGVSLSTILLIVLVAYLANLI